MLTWSIEELQLTLKYSWKISRNQSSVKRNFIITVAEGEVSASGEVAPNIRYGETPELIASLFVFLPSILSAVKTIQELTEELNRHNLPSSLRFGIESAYIHLLAKKNAIPVYEQLRLKAPLLDIKTSYTLPIMEIGEVKKFINSHNLMRFSYLKIKIDQETGADLIREVVKLSSKPLRIDANEAWQDVDNLLVLMDEWRNYPIDFIEQPLPSSMVQEYKYLKCKSPFELIADESVTNSINVEEIAAQFHGINMKLMKAGGYYNGIKIIQDSKKQGLKTMLGCMVETSLGIFSAINLSNGINYIDLDGHFLVENEPFKLVSEREGGLEIIT